MTIYVLPFEKMHGLGNDFIILEKRNLPREVDLSKLAKQLCHRNFAIGADGLIILETVGHKSADFVWRYFNSDGFEAEMCGHGMRCFAKYVFEKGFTDKNTFTVLTKAGVLTPSIEVDGTITVNMATPKLPENTLEKLEINSEEVTYTYVEVGNPHCVIFRSGNIDDSDFFRLGPLIEKSKIFPNGTNVEFAKIVSRKEIICRVWERGCGPTLACGTGACAVLIAAVINDLCDFNAKVFLPGGVLNVKFDERLNNVFLNGSADFVFSGQFNLNLN